MSAFGVIQTSRSQGVRTVFDPIPEVACFIQNSAFGALMVDAIGSCNLVALGRPSGRLAFTLK
jgi:hypothetical protein